MKDFFSPLVKERKEKILQDLNRLVYSRVSVLPQVRTGEAHFITLTHFVSEVVSAVVCALRSSHEGPT